MATEQLGICENCRQQAMCVMVEIAPCVRIRLCRGCRAANAMWFRQVSARRGAVLDCAQRSRAIRSASAAAHRIS
jgi:hypothetical protein